MSIWGKPALTGLFDFSGSGPIVSFPYGDGSPLKSLVAHIEPVQEGSGDPSPDNVRPISGWSAVNVWRTGKNLLSMTVYDGGIYNPTVGTTLALTESPSGKQFTPNSDKTVWTVSTSSTYTYYTFVCPVKEGIEYYVNFKTKGSTTARRTYGYLDKNFKVLTKTNSTDATHTLNGIISPGVNTKNCAYYYIILTNASTASETLTVENPMIELGTTPTAYEPYSGNTYPISWETEAGIVYGGTLDVTTGVLTVDRAMVDLGTLTWTYMTTVLGKEYFRTNTINPRPIPNTLNAICSLYKVLIGAQVSSNDKSIGVNASAQYIYIRDTRFTDASDLKTALAGQTFVYEIATPITYQLTPQQINTLIGENNIWADTGDVDVEYSRKTFGFLSSV